MAGVGDGEEGVGGSPVPVLRRIGQFPKRGLPGGRKWGTFSFFSFLPNRRGHLQPKKSYAVTSYKPADSWEGTGE